MIKYVTLALLIISVANGIEPNGLSKAGEGRNAKDDFELVMGAKATPLRSRASFSLAIDHAMCTRYNDKQQLVSANI